MDDQNYIWLILAIFILAYGLWGFLPSVVSCFFPRSIKTYFEENKPSKILNREEIQTLITEIKSLNFSYLGTKVEKIPLWGPRGEEESFYLAEEKTFASICYVRKVIYYYYTPFEGGQVILTANTGFPSMIQEDLFISSVKKKEPKELFEIHKENVESFLAKGFSPFTEYTKNSRLEATKLFYNSTIMLQQMRRRGAVYFLIFLVFCIPFILEMTTL